MQANLSNCLYTLSLCPGVADCCPHFQNSKRVVLKILPLRLISVLSKMAEAIIKSKIYEPIDRHGLLGKGQLACYQGKSCLTNHIVFGRGL